MGNNITPICVDKEAISDDFYTVREILCENGAKVQKGEIIGSFETSKAIIEIESPASGYVHYVVREDQEISVGAMFAVVSDGPEIPKKYIDTTLAKKKPQQKKAVPSRSGQDVRISKAAQKLIQKHDINIAVFRGKTIIRTEDINTYLSQRKPGFQGRESTGVVFRNKVVIVGGGGHTKMCLDILQQVKSYEVAEIVEYYPEHTIKGVRGQKPASVQTLKKLFQQGVRHAVVGVGALHNPKIRDTIFCELKKIGFFMPNLVHPFSTIEPSASLGEGNQVMAGAVISSNAVIGNNCIINSGSVICHDSLLFDNAHIAPGTVLAGHAKVGSNTLVGMGVTVYRAVSIGNNVIIHNGLSIVKDIPDNTIVKGVTKFRYEAHESG
jgi:UDP-perosamine 4-acetyltransferase